MKNSSIIKLSTLIISTLFVSNAIATVNPALRLAAKTESTETKSKLTDHQLADNVREKFEKEKLFGKDKFADMKIHVTADKGVVKLTGNVSSKDDEDKAVQLTKSVDGVKGVDSKLKVKVEKVVLTDNQLATNVRDKFEKEKLFGKDKFADMGIHVTASKGVITIKGNVDSKDDEDKAVSLAKSVEGVKKVDSKVKVKKEKKEDKK